MKLQRAKTEIQQMVPTRKFSDHFASLVLKSLSEFCVFYLDTFKQCDVGLSPALLVPSEAWT
jgi:hypothetical protein